MIALVRLYSRAALQLNALDVTRRTYEARTEVTLSTTQNIPPALRLPTEIDMQYDRAALIGVYGSELVVDQCNRFLVEAVTEIDSWMEDVFECALPIRDPGLTPPQIEKKVRSAWTDDNGMPAIRRLLLCDVGLVAPPGKTSTPEMVFDRYEEMRELRHAVMHCESLLTDKHVRRLTALHARIPATAGGGKGMTDLLLPGGIAVGQKVTVGVNELLTLRKWAYEATAYFNVAFGSS